MRNGRQIKTHIFVCECRKPCVRIAKTDKNFESVKSKGSPNHSNGHKNFCYRLLDILAKRNSIRLHVAGLIFIINYIRTDTNTLTHTQARSNTRLTLGVRCVVAIIAQAMSFGEYHADRTMEYAFVFIYGNIKKGTTVFYCSSCVWSECFYL